MSRVLYFLLLLLFSTPIHANSLWQEIVKNDLTFIQKQIQENTPNAVDKDHPEFAKWLESGSKEPLLIDSLDGYFALIERYVGGFQDPHIDFQPSYTATSYRWPGFIARYDGHIWRIALVESAENLSVGDEILKVDESSPNDLMISRIFPYQNLPAKWKASWQVVASELFIDKGNPFLKPLKKLIVRNPSGTKEVVLRWSAITPNQWKSLVGTPTKPWSIRGNWVSMPYFSVKNITQQEEIEKIIEQMPTLRTKDFVVLDLRGNPGGQSFWGTKALEALYGDAFPFQSSGGMDRWRVSKDNLSILKEKYVPFLKETTGEGSQELLYIEETIRQMEASTSAFAESRIPSTNHKKPFNPLFKGTLVVVTDSACASSCLTFLSHVLQMPGVIHVGQETTGNSPYVEGRKVELPSKLGALFFPMKIVAIDPNDYFKPFTPAHVFDGDIDDTKALEAWIQTTLRL